jgi:hypothetical protein
MAMQLGHVHIKTREDPQKVAKLSCTPCRSSWQPRPGISPFTVAPKLSM